MSGRRISTASLRSEHNTDSDQSDNSKLTEEFPDPGLPKRNYEDVNEKNKVSFNFPVEVITKDDRFGVSTGYVLDIRISLEKSSRLKKTKAEKEVLRQVELEDVIQEEPKVGTKKKENRNKRNSSLGVDQKRKPEGVMSQYTSKKEVVKEAKEAKEAKKRESEAKKRESEAKKREAEAKKREAEAKKREAEAKKQAAKKALEEERAAKMEFEEFNKIYKPGECLKYITIEIHPTLFNAWYMVDTLRELGAVGARVQSADTICDPGLLVWKRRVPQTFTNKGGQVALTSTTQQCPHSFYIMPAEQLSTLVNEGRCVRHMVEMQALAGTAITLIVLKTTTSCTIAPPGSGKQGMSREKLAQFFADLQIELMLSYKIDMIVSNTSMELATLVLHYTKAIAEAPYKRAKREIDEKAEFYMRGDNKNCVTVDKEGNGLSRLWEQMIAILPQSSLEVARTLGAEYKTPSALIQEFENGGGIAKIADIGVARANVPGVKTRRLGPEFARKLYTLFTTEDGDTVIE